MPETLAASCPACGHALSDHGDDPVHAVSYCRRDCGCLVGVAAKSEAALPAHSEVYRRALAVRVSNDFADNYAFTRTGVEYGVRTQAGDVIWSKEVWQRGTWLPWRPFYDRRIERAKRKAGRIWKALETQGESRG